MDKKRKIFRQCSFNSVNNKLNKSYGLFSFITTITIITRFSFKQLCVQNSSLFVFFLTNFICLQSSAQKINLNKAQYLLGDTIQINILPSNKTIDAEAKIIDLSKLKNMVYESDTNTFEAFADAELLSINNDTILKDNKIVLNNTTSLILQLRIYSLGIFKLLQNENDSTYIIIDDLDSLNVQSDIKDILPIFEDESFDWTWVYYLLGALVLMVLGYFIFKNRSKFKKTKKAPAAIVKAQYLITLEALEKIKQRPWTLDEAKIFQSELTEVLRKYIDHYFDKNAMSLTSDELIQSLNAKLSRPDLIHTLSELFSIADLVKFAKASPDVSLFQQVVDKAIHFVKETRIEKEA